MTAQRLTRTFLIGCSLAMGLVTNSPIHGCQESKDYGNVKPEELGVKPVASQKDPKTGFVVGGSNKTSLLKTLKEINGIPIEELEKSMRPDELSRSGFLGKDESLLEVMAEDNEWVTKSGLTHQELARHLRVLAAIGRRESGVFTYNGVKFKVRLNVFDGFQDSPFNDGTKASVDVILLNVDTMDGLKFSQLVPLMVERYGFYEGRGTSYRVDPKEIVKVLTFLRPAKGKWSQEDGKLASVTFDYGTFLTVKDINRLSAYESITKLRLGNAETDSECVEVEGELLKLGRLKNLKELHLGVDALNDEQLKFVAQLPQLQSLEINADIGYGPMHKIPICTDRCAKYIRSAKTLRRLVIHDGHFTDQFVSEITKGLPHLEELQLNSAELTDESLRFIAERCKNLKSLSIASDHFTLKGIEHLRAFMNLDKQAVSSPTLRKLKNPKDISRLLGTWEYVSGTYEGKPNHPGKNVTITITQDSWLLQRNGKIVSTSTWEIDSTRSPKWLTQVTKGGKINFIDNWVYKFDNEQLVLCQSSWSDGRRPKAFRSRKGDEQYLFVLRRKVSKD